MTNNDCLRRIRYILDIDDTKMIALFALADQQVTREQVSAWLKKDDDPDYLPCADVTFAAFLNGLIVDKRGKRDAEAPKPEKRLNNNLIFTKLKIAFNLQAEEILSILTLAGLAISKHELSAFFRRTDHKHYRECKDQILRNFLQGLQLRYRDAEEDEIPFSWDQLERPD
ncbi:MAG: DUF1456 family protein [Pseudohongiella sp.]|jgi:uncharacterized protein YehS (DUF1456 family)|nr:DUF1456 family protein [Pseudohongiella sp.]